MGTLVSTMIKRLLIYFSSLFFLKCKRKLWKIQKELVIFHKIKERILEQVFGRYQGG